MPAKDTIWDERKIEELRALWGKGLTAREIADRLGERFSRAAVIGKAFRLGLARHKPAYTPTDNGRKKPVPRPAHHRLNPCHYRRSGPGRRRCAGCSWCNWPSTIDAGQWAIRTFPGSTSARPTHWGRSIAPITCGWRSPAPRQRLDHGRQR
jgi:hypothetical protein